jgi:hypothetical protein
MLWVEDLLDAILFEFEGRISEAAVKVEDGLVGLGLGAIERELLRTGVLLRFKVGEVGKVSFVYDALDIAILAKCEGEIAGNIWKIHAATVLIEPRVAVEGPILYGVVITSA